MRWWRYGMAGMVVSGLERRGSNAMDRRHVGMGPVGKTASFRTPPPHH
jgi:hypothetical protein